MILIIPPQVRDLVRDRLRQMFVLRHDVCFEQWRWRFPNQNDEIDIDDFDTEETIYLVYVDTDRDDVIGCCRLNPTTSPYMVSELWSERCNLQPPPRDPSVWESSRFCISRNLSSKREYMEIMWRMCAGVCEYCVAVGIKKIAWYTGPAFYQTINSLMPVEPLGTPYFDEKDQDTYIAGTGLVDEQAVLAARRNLQNPNVQLTYAVSPLAGRPDFDQFKKKEAA
ncbi:MAG: acyl-homoserine-lactone synthase [Pseudomonadota bacterium]